jgi:hypothetical protein
MNRTQALIIAMLSLSERAEYFRTQLSSTERMAAGMVDSAPLQPLAASYRRMIADREEARGILAEILEQER